MWSEKRKVRIFGKGKCKLIANCANFWQGKCVNSSPILVRQWWRHFCLSKNLSLPPWQQTRSLHCSWGKTFRTTGPSSVTSLTCLSVCLSLYLSLSVYIHIYIYNMQKRTTETFCCSQPVSRLQSIIRQVQKLYDPSYQALSLGRWTSLCVISFYIYIYIFSFHPIGEITWKNADSKDEFK